MKRKAFRVQETTSSVVLRKGSWSEEEDLKLISYINRCGIGNWSHVPRAAGLARKPKSCRLRWMNYLRPDIRHRNFTEEEVATIIEMQKLVGNRWATIAAAMPGRTDNDIKNFWNTHLKKIVLGRRINTDVPRHDPLESLSYDTAGDNSEEGASKLNGLPSYEASTDSDGVTAAAMDQKGVQVGDSARMNECNGVSLPEDHASWADMARLGSPCSLAYHEFQDPYQFSQWWPLDSFCPSEDVGKEDVTIDLWHHIP
ncbi:hypothetical protein MLD38_010498 [Melastoma candidum]|uniref:Uncharacterized protein n=1 Tax=Melastoma candidum TaxID=119954 RepID=A0ACB9R3K1_9MYRT|nr:hypothetical protein MLD38_010498 [Melastoma candidum]